FLANLDASGLPPERLKIELTENAIKRDMEVIVPKLRALRKAGIRIAIDDFGTGYSSLAYLQHFPVNTLKIDRSFVGDIRADLGDASIINAIVAMARGLKLDIIAEGVETRTQLQYLKSQGCSEVQGYMFSRPLPAPEFVALLSREPFVRLVMATTENEAVASTV
ncbi:MAG TPA: EAL domain-containing protein, partial [Pseudomonadales bacterium]